MVRCIVKSCPNNRHNCYRTEISFFVLPKNEIIREDWIKKIGEVWLPSSMNNARICSVHFTEDSFKIGRIKKSRKNISARRQLLPNAYPTLKLSATENKTDTVIRNFNVIQKKFLLITNVHKNIDKKSSSNPVSTFEINTDNSSMSLNANPETNISEIVKTPKSHLQKELMADNRISKTSKSTFYVSDSVFNSFPRRSQRIKHQDSHHNIVKSIYKRMEKRCNRNASIKPKKLILEYYSEHTSPRIPEQRFMVDHCNRISDSTHTSTQEDSSKSIALLKAELEHHQSINKFHLQSRNHHSDEMQEIDNKNQILQLQLAQKDEENQNLMKEKEEMRVLINDFQKTIDELKMKLTMFDFEKENLKKTVQNETIQLFQPYFTEGQIRCILEHRKWIRWSIDDYASAISFRSVSPKTYRYFRLKLNFPLPSLSSLRRWALQKFDIREGFLSDVLKVMREKGKTFTSLEKITVLTFDEMSVSSDVQFDSKIEKMVGPYGKVQVIMARGLLGNWKQPIYYKFDQPMTKDILMEAVCHLYDAGFEVVATTCDMDDNKGVWVELHITPENNFFTHPVLKDSKIFVFADVPHLLKLLRNWFVDEGFLLQNCCKPFNAEILQAIIDLGNSSDLRVAHRLTQQILDTRHSLRQAVKPAARIWSHTVAKAIRWAGDNALIDVPDYKKFSDFVLTVNNWFDVHNSLQKYGAHSGVNGFGVNLKSQESMLISMDYCIHSLKIGSSKSLMPFQKGILISNASLRDLYHYLRNKYPEEFHYILTRHLQQDVLENFFAYIRAMGSCKDHPSGYEFRYRLRWYILGKHSHEVFTLNRNSEDVDLQCLSSTIGSFSNLSETLLTTRASNIPSPSIISTSKNLSCETSRDSFCNISNDYSSLEIKDYSQNDYNSLEIKDHLQNEIILTKELFSNIINISPEQLEEDSTHNNDDEENMDDNNDLIFESHCAELCTLYSGSASSNIVQEAGLKYIAGYVAHCFKKKYPNLEKPTNIAVDSTDGNWIHCVSRGYLTHPSDELIYISKIVERCFNDFHKDYFSEEDLVIQKVIALVKQDIDYNPSCIPDEVLQMLKQLSAEKDTTQIKIKKKNKDKISDLITLSSDDVIQKCSQKKQKKPKIKSSNKNMINKVLSEDEIELNVPKKKKVKLTELSVVEDNIYYEILCITEDSHKGKLVCPRFLSARLYRTIQMCGTSLADSILFDVLQ